MCNECGGAQRTLGEGLWDAGQELPRLGGPSRAQDAATRGLETPIAVQLCPPPPWLPETVSPSRGRHRRIPALLRNVLEDQGLAFTSCVNSGDEPPLQ